MKISITKVLVIGGVVTILVGALAPLPSMWKAVTVIGGIVLVVIGKAIEE